MSGIVGISSFAKATEDKYNLKSVIKQMADEIAHRGPDGEGYFVENNLALGHRLFKIPGRIVNRQPVAFDRDCLIVMHDGELYNWQEIKKELENKGYQFRTSTDVEIIAHAYQAWGADCFNKFNGGWAIVLYDKTKKILLGGRDHFGIKPFYYHFDRGKLLFASEMKAILAFPGMKARPNDRIVWDFLVDDLLDHSTETIFEGIKELWGGHFFILQNGRFKIQKYYQKLDSAAQTRGDAATNTEQFKELVMNAVQIRLPSDGPVAVSLSGGLDSSSVVTLNDKFLLQSQKQHTFSARFNNPSLDEKKYIAEMVKKTKIKPHYIFPTGADIKRDLQRILWHQEIPFSGTSIYAQWEVFKTVHKSKIKVILEGVGADVLLAGYTGLIGIYIVDLLKKGKIATALKELYYFHRLHGSIQALVQELFIKSVHFGVFGKTVAKIIEGKLWPEYKLITPSYLKKYNSVPLTQYDSKNIFNNSMINNFFISLNPVLRFEDRNLNAFGLSSRLPFIDYRIVEFGFALPDNQKIRNGQTKWILRQAMRGILPEIIRNRHDKIGFGTPPAWLKTDLKDEMLAVFKSKSFQSRGYFDGPGTVELFHQFLEGKIHHYHIFWRAYCLEMWFRIFIDK